MEQTESALEYYCHPMPIRNDEKSLLYAHNEQFGKCAGRLEFLSFFGVFSVVKLKKYTNITRFGARYETDQNVRGELICVLDDGTESVVASIDDHNGETELMADIKDVPDSAVLAYLRLIAKEDGARLKSCFAVYGGISSATPDIALISCTYKREEYIKKNVRYIADESAKNNLPVTVIIVDNGGTLNSDDFPEDAVLIHNINNGGSGGFSVGMQRASQMKRFTHFINMDDDVSFDFLSFQKLYMLLKYLKPQYRDIAVSGSMLFSDEPYIQFEAGGYFDKSGKQKGYGYLFDLSSRRGIIDNEADNKINYGGWWFMCIPMKCVDDGALPLPFFIKYDDVEYSLRCRLRVITLNGIGVWHERFENKLNSAAVYYNTRNYLHLCELYCGFDKKAVRRYIRKAVTEYVCRQQYNMAEAAKQGYCDYLKGMKYLESLDAEKKHAEISALNYKMMTREELEKISGINDFEGEIEKSYKVQYKPYMRWSFYGALLPHFGRKKTIVVPVICDRKEMYYRAAAAVHYNAKNRMGYVTISNIKSAVKYDELIK